MSLKIIIDTSHIIEAIIMLPAIICIYHFMGKCFMSDTLSANNFNFTLSHCSPSSKLFLISVSSYISVFILSIRSAKKSCIKSF